MRIGQVLIAQRNSGAHSGKWEFPGGKLEPGETPPQCLLRELNEEFEGQFEVGDFLTAVRFCAGGKEYELLAYQVQLRSEDIKPREHAAIRWIKPADLPQVDLLEPDKDIVKALLSKP